MNYWEYQASKTHKGRRGAPPVDEVPPAISEAKLEAKTATIEVKEQALSDTFIGRMRADLRNLWGNE